MKLSKSQEWKPENALSEEILDNLDKAGFG